MGFISGIVKIVTGDQYASGPVYELRVSICKGCKFYNPKTKSCGPLLIGKKVESKGKIIDLCGCIITEKAELKSQNCPANKW